MQKSSAEEFYDKMQNFFSYIEKMKALKNITKGHKQRFINMVIEFLKFKEKTPEIYLWICYIIEYNLKEINKYKKFVDEPVAKKLEQLLDEFSRQKINKTIQDNTHSLPEKEKIPIKTSPKKEIHEKKIKENSPNSILNENKENKSPNALNEEIKSSNNYLNESKLELNNNKMEFKINLMIKKINNYKSVKEFLSSSINKENKNNKIFCKIYQLTQNNLSLELPNTKQKILLLTCLIFPFISNKQKLQLFPIEQQFDKNFIKSLEDSKLLNKSKNNNLYEYLLQSIINKEINPELISKLFQKNLFIYSIGELFELYQIYLLTRILEFKGANEYIYKICFKIKFILENYNDLYYKNFGYEFDLVLKTLWKIKNFYTIIYENKLLEDENETINYLDVYFEQNLNNFEIIQRNNRINLEMLFYEEENKVYDELMQKIHKFYIINNNINLILGYSKELKNYEFPFNIIELINLKNELILNNFNEYKQNLINIEKFIYSLGLDSLFPNNINKSYFTNISRYIINPYLKNVILSLNIYLHKRLENFKFILYPYGSITEFLSDKESDIDLYLDISEIQEDSKKIHFLYILFYVIKNLDKKASLTISTRVCVITFQYKFISFDISVVGFCPYLHSALIREYSLIDPRFPLLVIAIKHIIKILKINNISDDKTHAYLNSFSWVLLLIGFLQDIIKPPVLPKILQNSEIIKKETFFGNNKVDKDEDNDKSNENKYEKISKSKNFDSFINNMEREDIKIPKNLGDINIRIKNYKNQIIQKNNMSCSELLLKFLEFVIFYFKYDTIFVNCSFEKEGFENIEKINEKISDDANSFKNYFNRKYIKKNKGEKNKDGCFLIRDPFDPRYNPAQTLKCNSLKKFFSRLRFAYYNLIKYGNLSLVKRQVEYQENKN